MTRTPTLPANPPGARHVPLGRCAHVLREGEAAVRLRTFCEAPARWLCVDTRATYCDEHAHETDREDGLGCCQIAEKAGAE